MRLEKLTIKNFKGTAHEVIEFGPEGLNIERPNGAGKSTVMHAYFWLLDGKDADNSQQRIKPELNGEEIHHLTTEVEAVFDTCTLRREQRETWSRPKGKTDVKYVGNETALFVDSVETKQAEWAAKLSELFPVKAVSAPWRLLSNPSYFLGDTLTVAQKNSLLMSMAVVPENSFIAGQVSTELMPYVERLNDTKSFIAALKTEAKREKDATADLPGKISAHAESIQRSKSKLAAIDTVSLTAKQSQLQAELQHLQTAQSGAVDKEAASNQKKALAAIAALRSEAQQIEQRIQKSVSDSYAKQTQAGADAHALKSRLNSQSNESKSVADAKSRQVEALGQQAEALRALYRTRAALQFDKGDGNCPTCSQAMPEHMVLQAANTFDKNKLEELAKIQTQGKGLKDQITSLQAEIVELQQQSRDLFEQATKVVVPPIPHRLELETAAREPHKARLVELAMQADEMEANLQQAEPTDTAAPFEAEIGAAKTNLDTVVKMLNEVEFLNKSIADTSGLLADDEAKLAAANENVAKREYLQSLVEQFQKAKNEYISDSVNTLFSTLKFVFVQNYIAGTEKEICEALVSGINYTTANTAARVNAGVELCKVMQNYFGVTAPVWVDNAESVQQLAGEGLQLIALRVSQFGPVKKPSTDWNAAKEHLNSMAAIYKQIGPSGSFALNSVIIPLIERYSSGERTSELYDEIMDVK